jgi:hypothetical protein
MQTPPPASSFAELGLRARIALFRALAAPARGWIDAPPLALPGRPPRLPATSPARDERWEGRGPREWRVYTRRRQDPRAPFLLRAVLPDAPPYDRLIDGAFQVFLNRLPDPAGRADYTDALDRGALEAGVVLRAIAQSPEARTREEEVRLLCAPVP